MGIIYGAVLQDAIYREMSQTDYKYTSDEKVILQEMLREVNELSDYEFNYLCELSLLKNPKGSGEIYLKYFPRFESHFLKAVLASEIASDVGKKAADVVLRGYMDFRNSEECVSPPGKPWPAGIYARYDNAFRKMKPKKLKSELIQLSNNPIDVWNLPFTIRMLSSWKIPEVEDILWKYLNDDFLNTQKFGWENENIPSERLKYRRNEVKFTALEGLKYYPSERYIKVLQEYEKSEDENFVFTAKKLKKYLQKHNGIVF